MLTEKWALEDGRREEEYLMDWGRLRRARADTLLAPPSSNHHFKITCQQVEVAAAPSLEEAMR